MKSLDLFAYSFLFKVIYAIQLNEFCDMKVVKNSYFANNHGISMKK